jgi:hypothetical protein
MWTNCSSLPEGTGTEYLWYYKKYGDWKRILKLLHVFWWTIINKNIREMTWLFLMVLMISLLWSQMGSPCRLVWCSSPPQFSTTLGTPAVSLPVLLHTKLICDGILNTVPYRYNLELKWALRSLCTSEYSEGARERKRVHIIIWRGSIEFILPTHLLPVLLVLSLVHCFKTLKTVISYLSSWIPRHKSSQS